MYRMNNSGGTPRERLDPRLLERLVTVQDGANCGCNGETRSIAHTHHHPAHRVQESCGCESAHPYNAYEETNSDFNHALAMVYSPEQAWQNLYCVEDGLKVGTIFRELDKPFYGPNCCGGIGNE